MLLGLCLFRPNSAPMDWRAVQRLRTYWVGGGILARKPGDDSLHDAAAGLQQDGPVSASLGAVQRGSFDLFNRMALPKHWQTRAAQNCGKKLRFKGVPGR